MIRKTKHEKTNYYNYNCCNGMEYYTYLASKILRNPAYRFCLGFHYHIGIYPCCMYISMAEQLASRHSFLFITVLVCKLPAAFFLFYQNIATHSIRQAMWQMLRMIGRLRENTKRFQFITFLYSVIFNC